MHNLLSKLFQKKGIKDVTELSGEEREVFENYQRVLSKEEMTMEDMRKFLEAQVSVIEGKWRDYNTPQSQKAELIPYHTVYRTFLQAIDAPQVEREQLEQYLMQLTK